MLCDLYRCCPGILVILAILHAVIIKCDVDNRCSLVDRKLIDFDSFGLITCQISVIHSNGIVSRS